ncbi:MAG: hypothetical protein HYY46_25110 [Deltaproteobacteria bacterium]|nr:hypothetical protein [Deltaproteobacteria bacterium]
MPRAVERKKSAVQEEEKSAPQRQQIASTKNIVERNLFDPERGAGMRGQAEADSMATQRIRSMILLGTAILGSSRYAILQGPSDGRPAVPGSKAGAPNNLRLKLGDAVEGFKLSEIHEKKVVFTKGASKVEVALDFFRKIEPTKPVPAAPARPGVAPNVPRRERVPPPPAAR